ncbi:MAG TPA: response regulator transcription factor [Geobacterales bacterium]|nr:response regulator transcription factor [Geobacterales bacterium]
MATGQLLLVVDDDPHIREVLCFALTKAGFRTAEASDGRQGLARFNELKPDLVILDVLMPELDGTDVCRAIRAAGSTPVIFLTSRDDEVDRIVGLELGGDDYVSKPFSPRELVARVRAVLRRAAPPLRADSGDSAPRCLSHGRLSLDLDRFEACWGGVPVALTATEFALLRTLLGHPGKVFSRDELMTGACGPNTFLADRTIDSHIRRIRQKFADIGGEPLETVHGVGYRLGACQ